MKTHVIQLERFDDVHSTKDRICWAKVSRVLLVWPRRGRIMRRMPDLVILDRYCRMQGAQLAVVTWDDVVAQNAETLGIPVYESIENARNESWRRPSRRPSLTQTGRISSGKSFQQLQKEARPVEISKGRWYDLPIRWIFFILGMGAVATLLVFLLPSAEITLELPTSTQELDIELWASPEIASANISGGIPAYPVLVTVEGRDDIRSTGTLSLPKSFAEGSVTFTNLTEEEIVVPVGTTILTLGEESARFMTTRATLLTAGIGETAESSIQAVLAGTSGNVDAGSIVAIEGELGLQLLVENQEATTGGMDQTEPSPKESDAAALRSALLNRLRETAISEISAMLKPGEQILEQQITLENILEETYEPGLNQPADRLSLKMQAEFKGYYYKQSDVESFAELSLNANLPQNFMAIPGSLNLDQKEKIILDDSGQSRWQVHVTRKIREEAPVISIQNQAAGQQPETAIQQLEERLDLEEAPKIVIHPDWWPRLPYFFMRIKVMEK